MLHGTKRKQSFEKMICTNELLFDSLDDYTYLSKITERVLLASCTISDRIFLIADIVPWHQMCDRQ